MPTVLLAVHESTPSKTWHDELACFGPGSVLGPAHSLAEAGRLASAATPVLLVADLRLRDGRLADLMRLLQAGRRSQPLTVLALVHDATDPLLLDALLAGADSFLLTPQAAPGVLVEQALGALAGEVHIPPTLARRLLDHFKARGVGQGPARLEDLSNPLALTGEEWSLLCELSVGSALGDLARRQGQQPRQLADRLRGIGRKMQWAMRAGDLQLA